MNDMEKLEAAACRWRCDPGELGYQSTREIKPVNRILGQEEAVSALHFGLRNHFKGNNIFVRGLTGFGRMTLIHQMIDEVETSAVTTPDYCYVHNFDEPGKPALLALPTGRGREFRQLMEDFSSFAEKELPEYLNSDVVKSKQRQLVELTQANLKELGAPLEQQLAEADLTLMPMQVGQNVVPVILPIIDGNPATFEELQKQRMEGGLAEEDFKAIMEKIAGFEQQLAELGEKIAQVQVDQQKAMRDMFSHEAHQYVANRLQVIKSRFSLPAVESFLEAVLDDLIKRRLYSNDIADFARFYQVNLVYCNSTTDKVPVVSVTNPNMINLIGSIDAEFVPGTSMSGSDHLMIKPGALLEANGGYLIVEAREILSEPGAWSTLLRVLKTGMLELTQPDPFGFWPMSRLRPEPIPVDIKVILVGEPETHFLLDQYEPRFANLFKVLADFGDTVSRDSGGFEIYGNTLARLIESDNLRHFSAEAVARLIEHGARICAQSDQLTSRFGRVADIARESSYVADEQGHDLVSAEDVMETIRRSRGRANLPSRRFQRLIGKGTLRIATQGQVVGQVNGLAVTQAGPLTYGFPTRITATVSPGHDGMINIERESDLSGAVHTKGFMILSGLMRTLLRLKHPMAFSSSIAFEQSYGGIDGDSASAAEFTCLLSALTEIPIKQSLAITGAVDQKGNILPIGAVTEKVEGFYDACLSTALSGDQGVIIPRTNQSELMLRPDVVLAISEGRFHVYAIDSIAEAAELLTDTAFGEPESPESGSLLEIAKAKAHEYWKTTLKKA